MPFTLEPSDYSPSSMTTTMISICNIMISIHNYIRESRVFFTESSWS